MKDDAFVGTFKAVMIFLIVFAFVIYAAAKMLTGGFYGDGDTAAEKANDEAIAERIAPVAKVREAGDKPAAAAGAKLSGKDVYSSACFACHGTGAAGAPKVGDKAVWSARIGQGNDKLYSNAINGFTGGSGVMPAKGGRADLSDDAVKAAVKYMVDNSK